MSRHKKGRKSGRIYEADRRLREQAEQQRRGRDRQPRVYCRSPGRTTIGVGADLVSQALVLLASYYLTNDELEIREALTYGTIASFAVSSVGSIAEYSNREGFFGEKSWKTLLSPLFFIFYQLFICAGILGAYSRGVSDYVVKDLPSDVENCLNQTTKDRYSYVFFDDAAKAASYETLDVMLYFSLAFLVGWLAKLSVFYWIEKPERLRELEAFQAQSERQERKSLKVSKRASAQTPQKQSILSADKLGVSGSPRVGKSALFSRIDELSPDLEAGQVKAGSKEQKNEKPSKEEITKVLHKAEGVAEQLETLAQWLKHASAKGIISSKVAHNLEQNAKELREDISAEQQVELRPK